MFPCLSALTLSEVVVSALIIGSSLLVGAIFIARIRRREFALLHFSLSSGIYGARLFLQAAQLGGGLADLVLTMLLPIPMVLLMMELAAPEWRKAVGWIVAVNLAAACLAIGVRVLHARSDFPWRVNNVVVLALMPLYFGMAFLPWRRPSRDRHVLRVGLVVFLVFAIYTNLYWLAVFSGLSWVGMSSGLPSLEFVGFLFLLGCLGFVALAQAQHKEEQLLALRRELAIARDIQAQLLPQPNATLAGLQLATRYLPATSVAGDFYDFLPRDSGLGVLIADVSGHGVPAALSASMVKVAVRAQLERAHDPAEVLREMNSVLCGNLQGQFVSAGYLFANANAGSLTYAGAGHPPLLVWRAGSGCVESLEENGLLLGILPESTYHAKTLPLAPGDRCLLYTDGLVEAPCVSGEEFGPERLSGFLTEHAGLPPQEFCDRLVERLAEWQGMSEELHDDLTVVVVDLPKVEELQPDALPPVREGVMAHAECRTINKL